MTRLTLEEIGVMKKLVGENNILLNKEEVATLTKALDIAEAYYKNLINNTEVIVRCEECSRKLIARATKSPDDVVNIWVERHECISKEKAVQKNTKTQLGRLDNHINYIKIKVEHTRKHNPSDLDVWQEYLSDLKTARVIMEKEATDTKTPRPHPPKGGRI